MSKEQALAALKDYPVYNYYENQANVFAMFLAFDARTETLKEAIGTTYNPILAIGKKRNFPMYMNHKDCLRIANIILDKIEQDQQWFLQATKEIYSRAEKLIEFSRKLKQIEYEQKENKQLLELYQKYLQLFKEMRVYSSIPTMLEHDTPVLSNMFKKKLEMYVPEEKINDVFSALTTPNRKSYLLQEEVERLQIAQKVIEKKEITKEIEQHTQKWNWKEYMFEGMPLAQKDFFRQVEEDLKKYPEPKKRIEEIEKNHQITIDKQNKYVQEHEISKELQELAIIAQDVVYLKYFRKGIFAESYYCVEFLLQEIGKRIGMTLDEIRAMFDWEIQEALTNNLTKEKQEEIKQRQEFCAFVSYNGKSYPITKEEAEKIEKENIIREELQKELKGQVACSGNVEGEVCIVNTVQDMKKMKEGMILVSVMTHPNLFPAMKIAKGIVTDIGGLSCHAAIVARELNIPCIIGTKNVTKVVRDGMKIALESSTGTIKIINNDESTCENVQ